jgi:hypothetical protein
VVQTETDSHPNNANALVSDPSDEVDSETTVTVDYSITIEKATNGIDADVAPGPVLTVGDPVSWVYTVSNPSALTLVSVFVNDTVEGPVSCPQTTLAPGEAMICTANGTAQEGQYANLGVATALPDGGGVPVGAIDPSHYLANVTIAYCNHVLVNDLADAGAALHEACERLTVGPTYLAEPGAEVIFSGGVTVELVPELLFEKGATIDIRVCGQSLCAVSDQPMPNGCNSCVNQICDVAPDCCGVVYDQACVDKVNSVCGLTCE